jgi:hypothetical protein
MASDFSAFLALIGKVVVWVIARTVDLVALLLLLASCALPWRLAEIIYSFKFDNEWRWTALVSHRIAEN